MTDRRDAPEPAIAEAAEPAPARPTRSKPEPPRRVARPRAARAVIALSALALAAAAVRELSTRLAGWLHQRPEYEIALDAIELVPPPPACLKGGRDALLRQVAATSGLGDSIAALAARPDDLARRFALGSPWIEAVDQVAIEGHPPGLRVALRYREPVAALTVAGGGRVYLDRHGVVLPAAEIDTARLRPLVALSGWTGPIEPRPGLGLAPPGSEAETRLRAATRLCAFLQERAALNTPARPRVVAVNMRYGASLLYVQTDRGLWALWGEAPGQESPGQTDANRKWDQLCAWLAAHPEDAATASPGRYLVFTNDGARLESNRVEPRSGDRSRTDAG